MPVFQSGSINTTALIVPDLYVQIVPPSVSSLNGVPTNGVGMVGIGSWGPVNSPVVFGDMASFPFGPVTNRKFDLATAAAAAILQGANNITGIRVTDGTDLAATTTLKDSADAAGATLTAFYTGTTGDFLSATLSAGSKASTFKVSIGLPGKVPEVFDNIGGAGATFWTNLVAAVNHGQSGLRGPSQLVVATVGASSTLPSTTSQTVSFAGGADGAASITAATLVGADTTPRTGVYALRNTGCSIAMLADADDPTQYASQVAFGLSEGMYMILTGPVSQSISSAVSAKASAGIDNYAFKLMLGDWIYFNDTVNNVVRLISPQGYVAGRLANLSPEQSSLNKQIYGIVGTQSTYGNKTYSSAELAQLVAAGIDVITNPVPGGSYFGCRIGHNGSSNPATNGDNYTRMTNYIAYTLNAGMGRFVGRLQSPEERLEAKSTIDAFLSNMERQKMIGDVNGGPAFQVTLDASNNPSNRVALGYQQCDVKVVYLSVVEKFIINVEGGTSVQISRASTQAA